MANLGKRISELFSSNVAGEPAEGAPKEMVGPPPKPDGVGVRIYVLTVFISMLFELWPAPSFLHRTSPNYNARPAFFSAKMDANGDEEVAPLLRLEARG